MKIFENLNLFRFTMNYILGTRFRENLFKTMDNQFNDIFKNSRNEKHLLY